MLLKFLIGIIMLMCTISALASVEPLRYSATLIPSDTLELKMPIEGHCQLFKRYGEHLKAGERLYRIEALDLEAKLARLELERFEAQDKLKLLENWQQAPVVRRKKRALNKALQQAKRLNSYYIASQELYAIGAIARDELLNDESQFLAAKMQVLELEEEYQEVLRKGNPDLLQAQQRQVQYLNKKYKQLLQLLEKRDFWVPEDSIFLQANTQSEQVEHLSSIQRLTEGASIGYLAKLWPLTLQTQVDQWDVQHIQPGQAVKLRFMAHKEQIYEAKVVYVSNQPVQDTAQVRYPIYVQVNNVATKQDFRIGMNAEIEISPQVDEVNDIAVS